MAYVQTNLYLNPSTTLKLSRSTCQVTSYADYKHYLLFFNKLETHLVIMTNQCLKFSWCFGSLPWNSCNLYWFGDHMFSNFHTTRIILKCIGTNSYGNTGKSIKKYLCGLYYPVYQCFLNAIDHLDYYLNMHNNVPKTSHKTNNQKYKRNVCNSYKTTIYICQSSWAWVPREINGCHTDNKNLYHNTSSIPLWAKCFGLLTWLTGCGNLPQCKKK